MTSEVLLLSAVYYSSVVQASGGLGNCQDTAFSRVVEKTVHVDPCRWVGLFFFGHLSAVISQQWALDGG